jgi:uncharacterized protein YlxW (UPF0749 family)
MLLNPGERTMKFNESKMLILIVCAILGFLIASQISFIKPNTGGVYTFKSYQQAVAQIRKLNSEIGILDSQKRKLESDLSKFNMNSQSTSQIIKQLGDELYKHDFEEGLLDVKGPGIIITLSDNPYAGEYDDPAFHIVHDLDLRELVWMLKNEGAEAISVNGQRVIHKTEFSCDGPTIIINGEGLTPPYIIKAIGDPNTISYALSREDGILRDFERRGLLSIPDDLKRSDDITIVRYDKSTGYQYMQPVKD